MEQKNTNMDYNIRKLYTLFLKKDCGEHSPFPITEYLVKFLKETNADGMFVMPGHLSLTSQKSGDKYTYQELLDIFLAIPHLDFVGFGNAYYSTNAKAQKDKEKDEVKNSIKEFETYLKEKNVLKLKRNYKSDHSKMIFVFKYRDECKWDYTEEVTVNNYMEFIELVEVIGVLTGSSNFSKSAYGKIDEDKSFIAYNGESDILMFYDENYKRQIIKESMESQNWESSGLILSENITSVKNDFFEDMLKRVLKNILVDEK